MNRSRKKRGVVSKKQINSTIIFFRTFFRLALLSSARDASPPGVVAALDPANTDNLDDFAPEADGRAVEGLFVGVDAGSLPDQVGLVRLDELGLLEDLPTAEGDSGCDMMQLETETETSKLWYDSDLPRMSMV
jgi:hypothetical protein